MDKTKGGDATLFRSADEHETKTKADQLAKLGKRCAEMETNKDFHGNQFGEIRSAENTKTKAEK